MRCQAFTRQCEAAVPRVPANRRYVLTRAAITTLDGYVIASDAYRTSPLHVSVRNEAFRDGR